MNAFISAIFIGLSASSAFAGPQGSGGGDLCEQRFKAVAGDIDSWLASGGASGLSLKNPTGEISQAAYTAGIRAQLANYRITCVSPGDSGYPVTVGGQAKECASKPDPSTGAGWIVCDRAKFYSGLQDPENDPTQYTIVHHEFATLAGLELPNHGDSQYWISNQIVGFLESQTVKKLVVRSSDPNDPRIGVITLPHSTHGRFAISPDLRHIAFSDTRTKRIQTIDLMTYAQSTMSVPLRGGLTALLNYSSNGKYLLIRDNANDDDSYTVSIVDTLSGAKLSALGWAFGAAFLPDSETVVTVDKNATFYVRQARGGKLLRKFTVSELLKAGPFSLVIGDNVFADMVISPDGKSAVVTMNHEKDGSMQSQQIFLIDLQTGKVKATVQGLGNISTFYGFSYDGKNMIVQGPRPSGPGIDRELQFIDVVTGQKTASLNLGYGEVDFPTNLQSLPNDRIFETPPMRDYAWVIDSKSGRTALDSIPRFLHDWILAVDPSGSMALGQTGRTNFVATSLKTGDVQQLWKADASISFVDVTASSVLSPNRALLINWEGNRDGSTNVRVRILPIPQMP